MVPNAESDVLISFVKKMERELKQGNKNLMDSVFQVVTKANKETMKQLKGEVEVCEAFRELMQDEIEELLEEEKEKTAEKMATKMATKMIHAGKPDEEIMEFTELTKEQLKKLKKQLEED